MIDIVELIDKYVRSGMIAVEERGPVKHPNSFRGLAVGLIAAGFFCTVLVAAHASLPGVPYLLPDLLTSIAAAPGGGFWLQIQDDYDQSTPTPPGYTVAYDGAPSYGNVHHAGLIAAFPGTNGYWIVTRDGKIHARGGAPSICRNDNLSTCSGYNPNPTNYLTAIAPTPTGKGYGPSGATVRSGAPGTQYRTAIPRLTMQYRRGLLLHPRGRVITSRSIMAVCIALETPLFTALPVETSRTGIPSAASRQALTPPDRLTDIGW